MKATTTEYVLGIRSIHIRLFRNTARHDSSMVRRLGGRWTRNTTTPREILSLPPPYPLPSYALGAKLPPASSSPLLAAVANSSSRHVNLRKCCRDKKVVEWVLQPLQFAFHCLAQSSHDKLTSKYLTMRMATYRNSSST